jgi:hypothetical protein
MRADRLGEALTAAGYHPRDVEFDLAIAKYLNSGGAINGMISRIHVAAARMPGMGQASSADNIGHAPVAQTRQPVEDGGAVSKMPQGQANYAPSSSSHHDERGRHSDAGNGQNDLAPSRRVPDRGGEGQGLGASLVGQGRTALPAATSSRTERGLSSIALVQHTIQKGLLQLRKTADGRAWASIKWHELYGMRGDGGIADLILKRANPPKDKSAELITILSNKQFVEIVDDAQKQIAV